ncbi:peptidase C1-like family protein [Xylariomycetidae sp. FL2044]|nr:peptidase C1-like family protein [Xylariomycetidae sp. FL2044]
MGAQQSVPESVTESVTATPDTAAHEKAVLERLRALHVDGSIADEDFVHVDNDKTLADLLANRQPEGLGLQVTRDWQSKLLEDPKNRLALSALSSANPRDILTSRSVKIADQQVFNIQIPFEGGPITNQRSSGRCWLFASTNVFRVALMRKYDLDSFEISQAYLFFWDKLEKANYFLENVIDTVDESLDSRLVQRILADPVSDGGQWDMVYNLVEKYGLVPQSLYPDSWNAMASSTLNYIVVGKLREYALVLRKMLRSSATTAATLKATKDRMMREIHLVLTLTLGPPPSSTDKFEWNFLDRNGKARTVMVTPLEFARDIWSPSFRVNSTMIANMVSLVHDPRHESLTPMTVDRLGNIVGGRAISYVNVPMATLKQACVSMLRAGLPVFFGSDVGKFSNTASGIMDLGLIDYKLGFNVDMYTERFDKAARLAVGESAMTHAMVLTAVHVDGDKCVRWRVQNSWGTDAGDKGWFVMSDDWMDEFVYQAVIDLQFLTREVREAFAKKPLVLPLWDPMGSLA